MNQAHQVHLLKMLDDVHKQVRNRRFYKSQAGQKDVKIQCTRRDNRGFTKKLYFNPGIYFDDESGQMIVQSRINAPYTTKRTRRHGDRRSHGDFSTPEKQQHFNDQKNQ